MSKLDLEVTAKNIKAAVSGSVSTMRKSLDHAMTAGKLLAQAQQFIAKDEAMSFFGWAKKECGLSASTTRRYLRVAEHADAIEAKYKEAGTDKAGLTLTGALALIRSGTRTTTGKARKMKLPVDVPEVNRLIVQEFDGQIRNAAQLVELLELCGWGVIIPETLVVPESDDPDAIPPQGDQGSIAA